MRKGGRRGKKGRARRRKTEEVEGEVEVREGAAAPSGTLAVQGGESPCVKHT